MSKIVLDVDGVLLNFGKKYIEVAENVLGKNIISNPNKYRLHEFLQVSEEENIKVWEAFNQTDAWQNIPPLPGVIEAVKIINQLKLDIYIVSSVDPLRESSRLINLKKIGLIPKEIYCVGDGNSHKHEFIEQIQPIAFVDDRLDHLSRSLHVPHLAWVDNKQVQDIEQFEQISARVNSLNEWVSIHLLDLISEKSNKKRLRR